MTQLTWPQRFEIEIKPVPGHGPPENLCVVTWLHALKAVAMATEAYMRMHPTARIYDVQVNKLGEAGRATNGTVEVSEGDLHDRFEW